jgi:erythromycin esterase-like protein
MTGSLWDAGWPGADVRGLLDSLPARPRLLGLGEPTHAIEDFSRARNELFRQLVAGEGYRSIAIESDCLAALVVDEYVAGGPAALEEVLRAGFSHGLGATAPNRELVAWLRESNPDRGERVRFYGFDAPMEITGAASPREPLAALHTYLAAHLTGVPSSAAQIAELAGDDARWTNPAAMLDASQSIGRSAEAVRLRLLADDLGALLLTESPLLIPASADEWWRANLHARTAAGLLRYHAAMADPSPGRIAMMCALRDGMMAENLAAIAQREAGRGPTLVFANNGHLQRKQSTMRLRWLSELDIQWWSAGAITATRSGTDYAFVAMDLGAAPHHGLPAPAPDTLQGVLAEAPERWRLYDSARLAGALGDRLPTLAARQGAPAPLGYAPLDPNHLTDTDGVLFLREAVADADSGRR